MSAVVVTSEVATTINSNPCHWHEIGTGIQVYTHGEMLPAHAYPKLKAFKHLAGNYGTAWQNQKV